MSNDSPIPRGAGRAESENIFGRTLSASLTVRDLRSSMTWYCDVMGFAIDRKYEREGRVIAVALKAGDERILIGRDDGARGERVKGEGMSLMITTAQDIDALAARVKERGGVLEAEPITTPWGVRMFRVRDPDGFKITISSVQPG